MEYLAKTECSCEQRVVILEVFCSKWKIGLDFIMGFFVIKTLTKQLGLEHELFFLWAIIFINYLKRQKMLWNSFQKCINTGKILDIWCQDWVSQEYISVMLQKFFSSKLSMLMPCWNQAWTLQKGNKSILCFSILYYYILYIL